MLGHTENCHNPGNLPDEMPEINLRKTVPPLDHDHVELIWSSSFLLYVYQLGIACAICEGIDNELLMRKVKFGSVSGGGASATAMLATLMGVGDIRYWYRQLSTDVSKSIAETGTMLGSTNVLWKNMLKHWNVCHVGGMRIDAWNDRINIIYTDLSSWVPKSVVKTKFKDEFELAGAMCASAFIPCTTSPKPLFSTGEIQGLQQLLIFFIFIGI